MNQKKSDLERSREILMADMERLHQGNFDEKRSALINQHVKAICEVGKIELGFLKEAGLQGHLVQNSVINQKQIG
jgi:hypothetical protein